MKSKSWLSFLIFLIPFFIPSLSYSASISQVAQSRYWKLLLHYRGSSSEADGPGFFLSPIGKSDPEAELRADVSSFDPNSGIVVGNLKQHPQCAFPERYRFLKEELGLSVPDVQCPDFQKWKSGIRPKSLTVIFAAPYLGSPSSLFGHTFLRIDSQPRVPGGKRSEHLDYSVSFEAATGGEAGGIGYAVKGLIGSYPGLFYVNPYILKLNQYISLESRDVWEYELNLEPEAIDRVLNHVWELDTTWFDYYFFDENCSYHLLSLIEVAHPDLKLRDRFGAYTIPADTIRVLGRVDGAIRETRLKPSLLKVLEYRLRWMTPKERERFFDLQYHPDHLTGDESAAVLDGLLDWQKYLVMNEGRAVYDAEKSINPKLLLARAKAGEGVSTETLIASAPREVPPHLGHRSSRWGARAGVDSDHLMTRLDSRMAVHDELDSDAGYLADTRLELGKVAIEYQPDHGGLRLEDLTLGEVGTFAPWSPIRRNFAWSVGGGLRRPLDVGCPNCVVGRIGGNWGIGASLLSGSAGRVTALLLPGAELQAGGSFRKFVRVLPKASVVLLAAVGTQIKASLTGEYLRSVEFDSRGFGDAIWHGGAALHWEFAADWATRFDFDQWSKSNGRSGTQRVFAGFERYF